MQATKDGRFMTFENQGPSGYAVYHDGTKSTRFYTEVGGGNCIFFMWVPCEKEWEEDTGYALAKKQEILDYLAEEALKMLAPLPGAFYKLDETGIGFYIPHNATSDKLKTTGKG